jgi:hypothetical protein
MDFLELRTEVDRILKERRTLLDYVSEKKKLNPWYPTQRETGKIGSINRRLNKLKRLYPVSMRKIHG